jgi:hypothetical protein
VCDRGGVFKLIKFRVENKFMLELVNAHEWERYKLVAGGPPPTGGQG